MSLQYRSVRGTPSVQMVWASIPPRSVGLRLYHVNFPRITTTEWNFIPRNSCYRLCDVISDPPIGAFKMHHPLRWCKLLYLYEQLEHAVSHVKLIYPSTIADILYPQQQLVQFVWHLERTCSDFLYPFQIFKDAILHQATASSALFQPICSCPTL